MNGLWKPVMSGMAFCAVLCAGQPVFAQTLQSYLQNGTFTYGNEIFQISGCSLSGLACSNISNVDVIGVFNGRGGTEIELAPISTAHSYIYSSAANGPDATLSFTLTVTDKPGSKGLSSITDILNASTTATNNHDNSLISSTLSNFTGVTSQNSPSVSSQIGSLSSSDTFTLTNNPVSLKVSINFNSVSPVGTLTLTNIKLLLNPAPEPASIALFLTGVTGLAAIRRRAKRSNQATNADA